MARTSALVTIVTSILLISYSLSFPVFGPFGDLHESGPRLNARSRGAGAQCPYPLFSTIALNTDQDPSGEYRLCCPASAPDGMKIVDEVVCCKHVTDADHPEGCTGATGTLVYPASVKGCDKGWKKKQLKGIKYCFK